MAVTVARLCGNPRCAKSFIARASQVARGRGVYCSRRCLSSVNATRNHERYPQAGEANPSFKGWRSRNKRAYVDRFRDKYPEKALAHDVVEWALRSGRIVRPGRCQRCHLTPESPVHAHHEDYTRPLVIDWLCRSCHRIADEARRLRLAEAPSDGGAVLQERAS